MTARKYIQTLEDFLLPTMEGIIDEFGVPMTFMQDNAPCHKAKIVTEFYAEMVSIY